MTETPDRTESIFAAAVALPSAAERAAYLDQVCAGDAALRGRIEALLRAHERAGHLLDRPVPGGPDQTGAYVPKELPGTVIAGRYKLLEAIGEGGMGAVWVAEQTQPVRRKVALKLIKAGMDSKSVLARFEAERQALAVMDHPNIAKVLDGGLTETGRPFFVMEYIKGVPITEYCDAARLSVPERLNLFVQVCQAVQHAHQKGIIHRDLKPSNILVAPYDDKPVPKVIDFGLAKAMHQSLTERTLHTAHETVLGTPLYMSPEQAQLNNLDVDTRSDIYSLGVLLYELLTGTTPLEKQRFKEAAWDEIKRIIREEEAPRPSTRLSSSNTLASLAAGRQIEPARLTKLVRGELDWIVMKALEKDRSRRYETANGFAADVQRYLAGEPVLAVPPSAGYRLRKFARKHRAALTTAAAIGLLLVAGVAVSTWQAVRATRAEVAALAERDAKEQARQAEETQRREAETQRGRADKAAATAQATQTFLLTDTLGALAPEHTRGKQITIDQVLAQAATKAGQAFREQPEGEAAVRATIGHTYMSLGLSDAAQPQLTSALEIRRRVLGEEHLDTLRSMRQLGYLKWQQGKASEAETLLRQAAESQKRVLGEEHPDTLDTIETLALVLRQSRRAEAERLYRQNLAIGRRVLGPEHPATLSAMSELAALLNQKGELAEAESLARAALEGRKRVFGLDHDRTMWSMNVLGTNLHLQKKLSDAEPLFRKTLETSRRVLGDEHPYTLYFMYSLGHLLLDLDHRAEAESFLRVSLDTARRVLAPEHRWTNLFRNSLVPLLQGKRDWEQAEVLLRETLAVSRTKLPKDDPQLAALLAQLGQTLLHQNKAAEAEPNLRECLAIREKTQPDAWTTFNTKSLLGGALLGQKKYADAEPLLLTGYEGMKQRQDKIPANGKVRLPEAIERLVQLYEATDKKDDAAKWRKELESLKKK